MEKRHAKRIFRKKSPVSKWQLEKWRTLIADEVPDLIRRNRLADEAMKEKTFSGGLRRLVHEYPLSPMKIATLSEISWIALDDFLTGEKPLPSDAIDRLAKVLKLKFPPSRPKHGKRTPKRVDNHGKRIKP